MADRLDYQVRDGIGVISMDDGKANAIGGDWLNAFARVLEESRADDTTALVITGRAGFFSGGLDLKELPTLPSDQLRSVTDAFVAAMRDVFLFPKPVIAASTGHAIAGGMMLYLAADVRFALDAGAGRYGLNEAITGIPLLGGTVGICEYGIPPQHHTEFILHGRLVDARTTFERGITDRLCGAGALLDAALAHALSLRDLVLPVYAINKRILRGPVFANAVEVAASMSDAVPLRNPFPSLD
jgi:enoyl-CoA hydratase